MMLQAHKAPAYVRIFQNSYLSALKYWHVLLVIALPLFITVINPNWIYNPDVLNDVDTWVYHGLFRYFFDFAKTSPSNAHYFIERLSWVLPGYALYKIFTPVIANAILHLSVYYIGLFAIYGTARQLFGKTPAFIAAICLGSYTWYLRATGHDYLDGAGIAYFSAAIWFATAAAYRPRARWYLFGAGACLSLALVTQLTWAAFIPVVAIYYLLLIRQWAGFRIFANGLWVAFGGLVVLAGFVLFNLVTLGEWNIFNNSIWFVRSSNLLGESIRNDISLYYAPTPSTWFVLPCLIAICAIWFLARWDRVDSKFRAPFRTVIIAFSLMMGVFSFLHFMSPFQYFYVYLYASFLIPVTFLLFAGVIAAANPPLLSLRQALIALLLVLTPFALIVLFGILEPVRLNVLIVWFVTGISMALIAFGVLKGHKPFVVIGAFSVMSFIISGHNGVAFHDRLHTYKRFIGTDTILETINAQLPQMSRFSDYVIWNETRSFGAFAHAVRGISQPIGAHAKTLGTFHDTVFGYEPTTDVILLSDNSGIFATMSDTLGSNHRVIIKGTFKLPSIDSTGGFRGYILKVESPQAYDTAIIPSGENIRNVAPSIAWTGPDTDVVMEFNLPTPAKDVYVELCGIMSILPLDFRLPAVVNEVPVTFLRQPGTETCSLLYQAKIPKIAINSEMPTKIALTVPTAPADQALHNGDTDLYGLAISAVTFSQNTQTDPYNTALVPEGINIYPEPHQNGDIGPLFWTGEGSDVVMTFNLPSPQSDVEVQLCGNMSNLTLGDALDGAINGMPIIFQRQQPAGQCNLLYTAEIPQAAISGDALTELAIIIPTGPADLVFHNGDMRPLGMAILSISFNTRDTQ